MIPKRKSHTFSLLLMRKVYIPTHEFCHQVGLSQLS